MRKIKLISASSQNLRFELYDEETNTRIVDFTGYKLNFFILSKDESLNIIKQFPSTVNNINNTFDVTLNYNATKDILSGEYLGMLGIKLPNNEQHLEFGLVTVEKGMVVSSWL